jgi:hypothetical protein
MELALDGRTKVIDSRTRDLLQGIVGRESHSLLMYIADAFPWTTSKGAETLTRLHQLSRDEAEAIRALGRFLARHRIPPPPLGAFPSSFTTLNFVALDHLLPRLLDAQRTSTAALEKDLPALTSPEARAEVEKLLAAKQKTLTGLETLTAGLPTPAGV